MSSDISPIIQASELLLLHKSENLVIADVSNGKDAKANYEARHLEGALFIDLGTQLADIQEDLSVGGRHPLPKPESFGQTLSDLGISAESHVVIYDHKSGANAAARFWWMLKSIGHKKVQVLNGGIQEAERMKFPISAKVSHLRKNLAYKVDGWKLPIAKIDEAEKSILGKSHLIIDIRDSQRYNGDFEPLDLVAGHIPGAINIPFAGNLDKAGLFLSAEKLKEKYESVFENYDSQNIIIHCGSGVTACHSLLAIAYAGLEIPKLYVGSWSEWSRNGKSVETKTQL